jgi:hypothetical protein
VTEPERCDFCYRVPVTTVYLRRGPLRVLLGMAPARRRVCGKHLGRSERQGGWHG